MARTISTAVSGSVNLASTDNPLTITSTGSITTTASGDALTGASGTAWQVTNYGTISGLVGTSSAGIYFAGSGVSLQNSGTIKGYSAGIWASNGGTFTNNAGGLISATSNYGIYVGGAPGTVVNNGTISSGWLAVDFAYSSASNRLVVGPGAVFNGQVLGGNGTLELASGATSGSITGLNTGPFNNFGALVVDSGATWTLSGSNTIASVTDNGTLVVTGSLPAANYQIGAPGGGGTLEVASATGTASPINFAGNSTLVVDNAAAFGTNVGTSSYTGPLLENFAAGDTIDIKNVSSSGASVTYSSTTGLLQIANGSQSASLDFQNSTLGSGNFTLAPDAGGSGLYLTLSSGPTVTERLVADTGSSSTDKITSNDALTGTAAANAVVTLSEGGTTLGTATADASGLWNFTPSLTQGTHSIVATSGSASGSLTFTYDTVAPAVTEALVNNLGQNVTPDGALTGSGDANALVTLSENGTTLGTTTANASGVWNYTPSSLTAGAHTIVASETDAAGNTGTMSLAFTYSPPAVTEKLVADTGSSSTDGITSNDALTGTAGANATVTLKEGSTTLGTTTANTSGVWNYTPSPLAQGAHTISATSGGNSASLILTYDSIAPTPIFTQTPPATGATSSATFGFGTSNTDTGVFYGYKLDSASTWTQASGNSLTLSGLANGAHTLLLEATDAAGNVSAGTNYSWTVGSGGGQTISSAVTGPLTLTTTNNPLAITSTGSVKTTASGADAIDGGTGTSWSITNAGTVSSSQRFGISLHSSSSVVNSGTISGYSGQGGYGVDLESGGTVTNTSGGYISGGEDAVFGYGAAVNVDNSGHIISAYDDGIGLFGGGSIINRAGAVIQAPTGGGFGPAGIYIPGGSASVQNFGTISAQYGAYLGVAGTVENAGTISGTSYSVDFAASSASNRLIVDPGAVFNGAVKGGSGTLELASGTGSIGGVSSSGAFQGFQTLAVDAGGTWTLSGTDSIANLIDNGVLNIGGSLAVSTAVNPASTGAFDLLAGSTFEVAAMAAQTDQVSFQGSANLVVDNAGSFGVNVGTYAGPLIENFGSGSTIDIKNVSSTNATFNYTTATGLLQISNSAGQTASLDFQNSTLGSGTFQLAADGHGGVSVTHK